MGEYEGFCLDWGLENLCELILNGEGGFHALQWWFVAGGWLGGSPVSGCLGGGPYDKAKGTPHSWEPTSLGWGLLLLAPQCQAGGMKQH